MAGVFTAEERVVRDGVLIASALLGEAIRLTDMIGVAIVMAGILAVQLSREPVPRG